MKKSKAKKSKWKSYLAIGAVLALVGVVWSLEDPVDYTYPKSISNFAETSVRIVNRDGNRGGSGVIFRSNEQASYILTNKHICKGIKKDGGFVIRENSDYQVLDFKESNTHDICMVRVVANFRVNTKLASNDPTPFSKAFISGHPNLLPHVLVSGSYSRHLTARVLVAWKTCTPEDGRNPSRRGYCLSQGKYPVIEEYDALLVTATIMPGSSGSAIFNEAGEITNLVFAGPGRGMGYALAVPYRYLRFFLEEELNNLSWVVPGSPEALADPEAQLERFMPQVWRDAH